MKKSPNEIDRFLQDLKGHFQLNSQDFQTIGNLQDQEDVTIHHQHQKMKILLQKLNIHQDLLQEILQEVLKEILENQNVHLVRQNPLRIFTNLIILVTSSGQTNEEINFRKSVSTLFILEFYIWHL